jgi:hypothetical protein
LSLSKRHARRLTLACVALALFAAFGAGAVASGGLRARAAAPSVAGTFVLTDFGAAGDGVTDDGPALQAALDALGAAGGGTLLVPAGRYAIVTPVSKNFGGLAAPVNITGVASATEPPSPDGSGEELTRGLNLTSEFLPRTGADAAAVSIGGLQSLTIQELAFVGTPDVTDDALVTLFFHDVGDVSVRHSEFYGLASMDGAVVMARRSSLKVERSVFLGCATSSGTYSSVVQNIEWKGVSVTDTVFTDYGQRPELFGKLLTAPFSWVNLGNTAAVDNESPRREAVFRNVFFDEGGLIAISSTPARYEPPGPPIDLLHVSMLRMNVSNLRTSGLYLTDLRGALVEDGRFGWSQNSHSAVSLTGVGSAILSRIRCADGVTRVLADSTTARFVAVDAACPEILSDAPVTRVFNAAVPDDDPVRYVTARFRAALGRDPDPAAHFYWADRVLRCGTDAACVTSARAALVAHLASRPQPTFTLEGRATDEAGAAVAGVAVALSGSQTVSTTTGADGRYHFRGLPTSGVYAVAASKRHYTFATPQRSVVTPAGAQTVDFGATLNRHQIAGRVTDGAARGVAGVTVALSGSRSATATTDANGGFSFNALPAGGNYTVTPSGTRYSLSPSTQSVADLGSDVFLAFGATPLFYSISGQVSTPGGLPLGGVSVALGGSKLATAVTNPQGFFLFTDVPSGGSYTVTPGTTFGYTFTPASKSFTNVTSDQGSVFTGTPTNFKISGRVTASGGAALSGVTLNVTGSQAATATTDAAGNYSVALPVHGSYTVTASKQFYTFAAPATVNPLSSDRTADFAATLNRHGITGRVTRPGGQAMSGVAVTLSGSQVASTTTDAGGNYAFQNLAAGGDYAVTPSRVGYAFAPASKPFAGLGADQTADFTVTPGAFALGGRVTASGGVALSGVTVALSGSQTATATTDTNGAYSFNVSSEGNYTVTPSKQHYTFAPQSLSFADPLSNKTADFAGTLNRHKITGRVARPDGRVMSGVTLTLSGAQAATATTDANGDYGFLSLPAGGDYTVTPSKAGYDFGPAARTFNGLGADQSATFVVTPATYTVGGRVTSGGAALSGVAVTLSGSRSAATTTDANGAYSFDVSSEGTYTVTPAKTHYTFAPQGQTFADPLSNKTADFAATLNRHKITGRVARADGHAMSGVTLTLSGSQTASATTDANGNYSFPSLPAGGDYAVTPSRVGYDFSPKSKSFAGLGADQTADFTVTPLNFAVGGRVTSGGAALSGVIITLSGSQSATATSDANGAYSFSVSSEGNYTVTPAKTHYTFAPQSLSFTNPVADSAADFAATLNRHTVSGRVTRAGGAGMAGVTVTLGGSQTASATTDAGGNYAFQNLAAGGSYTVAASKANYTVGPASAAFDDLGTDRTADFTATPVNFTVGGRVTASGGAALSGVTVTLNGSQSATATTDANGAYSFSVPADGDYTVTPSKRHYSFAPASASFGALDANRAADFVATLGRHAVRGRVTDPNNYGLGGVSVTLGGSQSATATTDAGGEFSFPNLDAGGSYTVTPSAATLAFSPASQTFADLGADAHAVFVGTLARYHVAGRVTEQGAPLAGVTLELSGAHPALGVVGGRFTTGDDGSYSFEVLAGGDYAVTPSKKNYSFGPAAAAFDDVISDRAADFAATPLPTVGFAAASYSVAEDGGSVTVTVTRGGDATREVTVVYQALGDTARRGSDFLVSIGRLTLAPGETSKTFEVFITDDAFVEGAESFTLTLTPGEGAAEGESASARVTIGDNDAAPSAANPVDGEEFFVRQHYRDFFSREPDADGLAFWTGEINRCGADAACREARRATVSAAFFLSIEFQETGFLVYRLYKAAYGRAPERVEEFMLDARVMGDGVVVGRPGWEQRLAANKATSLRAFVERTQFAARYPATMTPSQFVDALFLSAGVAPAEAEREAAVDDFGGAPTSADEQARAFALRRVAEHPALAQAELNRAFVMMQYFGYLRRGPDEAPDTNLDGYNYWLGKLVDFGGDYQKAEMVKAFLASAEYRGRFGN